MKTYTSDLKSKPSWLGTYTDQTGKISPNDFGFGPDGMYFTGGSGGTAYSVRTNWNISGHQACEIIFTVDHTDNCTDQSVCFYNDGMSPNWSWGPDTSRIAFSINCPTPYIYGTNKYVSNGGEFYGDEEGDDNPVLGSGLYTFKVTYNPAARTVTAVTYEGSNTLGTVLDTIVLHEKLMDGGPYRIGFDADNDNGTAYFKSLQIKVYETNGEDNGTDVPLYDYLQNLKEKHAQITDLVEGDLFNFSDDFDLNDTADPNFNEIGIGGAICIQENGYIVVGGNSGTYDGSKNLRRVGSYEGLDDETFTPPVFNNDITSIVQMSDGRLVVGGNFNAIKRFDGPSNSGSITFDTDIDGNTSLGSSNGLSLSYDANMVEVGWTVTYADASTRTVTQSYFFTPTNRWIVAVDSPIAATFPITISQPNWNPTINGDEVQIGGMVCLNSDGSISKRDGGSIGFEDRAISSIPASVYTIKLLDDDSVLVGGHFTHYDNVESPYLAKIGSDGVIDESFASEIVGLNLGEGVSSINIDGNGKILVGGLFSGNIKRLNSDGTLDNTFDSGSGISGSFYGNAIYAILPLSNGKILVGHGGDTYNGSSCNPGLIRLNGDGSLDTGYISEFLSGITPGGNGLVLTLTEQSDGKVLVGGLYDHSDGSSSSEIARINTDGTLDTTFNIGFGFTNDNFYSSYLPYVNDIKLDSEGYIYVAGSFTDYNHAARFQYAALDTNGALTDWSVRPAYSQWGIDDGMLDLYDGGNYLNTNLTAPYLSIKCYGEDSAVSGGEGQCLDIRNKSIPSTHTQAWDSGPGDVEDNFYDPSAPNDLGKRNYQPVSDSIVMVGDGYFGDGSSYFTAMFPGMFVLAADNISITEFSITGNIGTDGSGVDVAEVYPITVGGSTYTAYLKSNYSGNDPSINHIIIVDGNGDGIEQFYDPTSRGDEHCLTGLQGKTKLFYLLISKGCSGDLNDTNCGNRMSPTEVTNVANAFISTLTGSVTKTYRLNLSPNDASVRKGYTGEGCMDDILVDGKSIQRTGYYEVVNSNGGRKVVEVKDGEIFDDSTENTLNRLPVDPN